MHCGYKLQEPNAPGGSADKGSATQNASSDRYLRSAQKKLAEIHDDEQVLLDSSSGVMQGIDFATLDDVKSSGVHQAANSGPPRKAKAVARKRPTSGRITEESMNQTTHDGDTLDEIDASDLSGLLGRPSVANEPEESSASDFTTSPEVGGSDLSAMLRAPAELQEPSELSGMLRPPKDLVERFTTSTGPTSDSVEESNYSSDVLPSQNKEKNRPTVRRPTVKPHPPKDGSHPNGSVRPPAAPSSPSPTGQPQSSQPNSQYSAPSAPAPQTLPAAQIQQPPSVAAPVYVPVPQYVPVPVASPSGQNNPVPLPDSQTPAPPTRSSSEESTDAHVLDSKTSLDQLNVDSGDSSATIDSVDSVERDRSPVDQSGKGKDASSDQSSTVSSDASRMRLNRLAQKQGAFHDLFLKEVRSAEKLLQRKQEPASTKTPKSLTKIVNRLEGLEASDIDGTLKQLKAAGAVRHEAAVDIIRDYSTHNQKDIRGVCVELLERIATPQSGLALLRLLQDKTPEIASKSALALLNIEQPETLRPVVAFAVLNVVSMPAVRELLESEPKDQQNARSKQLAEILREPVDVPEFQAFALHLISRLQQESATKLCQKCLSHSVPEIRATAIEALALTKNKRCVGLFNKAMADTSPVVQAAAAEALSVIHSPKSISLLIRALMSDSAAVRRASAQTLVNKDDSEGVVAAAASKAIQKETDQDAMASLLDIVSRGGTEEAVDTLKRLANGEDDEARYRAIQSLRKVKSEKTVHVLLPLMEHQDAKTRKLSVDALGRLKAKKALSSIRSLLSTDPDESVRATCARCLGELKDEEAVQILEDAFQDGRSVQVQAVIALGLIGSKEAIPSLMAQLRSQAPEVRFQACNALGLIGGLKNTEAIEALLEDKDPMVQRGAEVNLEKLGAKVKSSRWSRNMKRQLRRIGAALIPDSMLSMVPGGNGALVAVAAVAVVGVVVYAGMQALTFVSAPGAGLPVTRISSIAVDSTGSTAYASRGNGVIDVWDLKEGKLTDRFKPNGRYSVLSSPSGDKALLYGNSKAVVFNRAEGFSETTEAAKSQIPGIVGMYQPADPRKLWVVSDDGSGSQLSLIDRTTFAPEKQIKVSERILDVFAVNSDQSMVVIPTVKGLELLAGPDLKPLPKLLEMSRWLGKKQIGAVKAASFNATGQLLALACEDAVVVIALPEGELVKVLFEEDLARAERLVSVRFTGTDNNLVAYSNKGGAFLASDEFETTSTAPPADSSLVEFFSVSADQSTMVYARPTSKDLIVADLKSGQIRHELKGKQ